MLWVVITLWVLLVGLTVGFCLQRIRVRAGLLVVLLLLLAGRLVVARVLPFYGLEYEDAYEYVYAGLFFLESPRAANTGLNPLCLRGSVEECSAFGTLSHPIGAGALYTVLLSATGSVAGARILAAGLLSGLSFFSILAAWPRERQNALGVSLVVVGATPLVGLYAITGFAEVAGAAVLASFVLVWSVSRERGDSPRLAVWLLLAVSSALLPLVKRELVLVPALAALWLVAQAGRKPRLQSAIVSSALVTGIGVALLTSKGAILDLTVARTSGRALLSLGTLFELAPMYLKQSLISGVFVPYGILLLCALVVGWRWPATRFATLVGAVLLVLGLSFSQSYYFALSGEPPTVHFERYSYLLWPLVTVILAGVAAKLAVPDGLRNMRLARPILIALLTIYVTAGVTTTVIAAKTRHREEVAVRFGPVHNALHVLPPDGWLITLDPILVTLVSPQARVIDLPGLVATCSKESFREFVTDHEVLLLLPRSGLDTEEQRYPDAFEILLAASWQRVPLDRPDDDWDVLRPRAVEKPQ